MAEGVSDNVAMLMRVADRLAPLRDRLVMLRLLEAPGPDGRAAMRSPAVVTGGWESRGYTVFRELAPALVRGDATERTSRRGHPRR